MKRALGLLIAGLLGASAAFASNSLTVTSPGLAPGPTTTGKKLQVNCDGSTNNVYVETQEPNGETHYKATFSWSPGNLNLDADKLLRIGAINTNLGQNLLIFVRRNTGDNGWGVKVKFKDDVDATFRGLPYQFIMLQSVPAGTTRLITVEWQSDSSEGAGDGFIKVTKANTDGGSPASKTKTDVNNDDSTIELGRFGVLGGSGNICNGGAFYFDEFSSFR